MKILGSSASSSSYLHASSPGGSAIGPYGTSSPISYSPMTPGGSSSISAASPYNNPQTPGSGMSSSFPPILNISRLADVYLEHWYHICIVLFTHKYNLDQPAPLLVQLIFSVLHAYTLEQKSKKNKLRCCNQLGIKFKKIITRFTKSWESWFLQTSPDFSQKNIWSSDFWR